MSLLPSQDPVQLQMDRLPDLRTVSLTSTVQAGRNAARDPAASSAVILQVNMILLLLNMKLMCFIGLGLY